MSGAVSGIIQKSGLNQSEVDARVVAVAGEALNGKSYLINGLADNAAWSFDFGQDAFVGNVIVSRNAAGNNGIFEIRATSGLAFCSAIVSNAITATTGVLAGTTGADGAMTISTHTDNKLYIENRLGGAISVCVTINSPYLP